MSPAKADGLDSTGKGPQRMQRGVKSPQAEREGALPPISRDTCIAVPSLPLASLSSEPKGAADVVSGPSQAWALSVNSVV